ncbi:MAG: hypothetical protein IKD01_04410, partial [Oscillospiraceae bacterium]|nr:hypothetical protein [Oscillospiraceae bacterium]
PRRFSGGVFESLQRSANVPVAYLQRRPQRLCREDTRCRNEAAVAFTLLRDFYLPKRPLCAIL